MNKYGRIAHEHWTKFRPQELAKIESPTDFFSTLGQQIEDQVVELTPTLAGADPAGEDYLQKVGRLNAARQQAEEQVLTDLVWESGPNETSESETEEAPPNRVDAFHRAIWEASQEEPLTS
ncbi:hypothetical protein NUM3379_35030 [Kineococcus sp. NUM-3379]